MVLLQIYSIREDLDGSYSIDLLFMDEDSNEVRANYTYRSGDVYGLSPSIKKWIADNNPEILPYNPPPPPTPEELRAQMPKLTPRQFRDALIDNDIMPDQVTAAINQIPEEKQRAKALNAWEYPTEFTRTDPLIDQIGAMFEMSPEYIDVMWSDT